jgi:hypothetical protein
LLPDRVNGLASTSESTVATSTVFVMKKQPASASSTGIFPFTCWIRGR